MAKKETGKGVPITLSVTDNSIGTFTWELPPHVQAFYQGSCEEREFLLHEVFDKWKQDLFAMLNLFVIFIGAPEI